MLIINLEDNKIIKDRISKGYRIKELDEKLRKLRTRTEARLLEKASKLISVPKVLSVNEKTKQLELEFIDGLKLSEHLDNLKNKEEVMHQLLMMVKNIIPKSASIEL
jgi:TP53 regulating kinase-like protein